MMWQGALKYMRKFELCIIVFFLVKPKILNFVDIEGSMF